MGGFFAGLFFRLKLRLYLLFFGDKVDPVTMETINDIYKRKTFDQADLVFLDWNWKKYG